MFSPNNGGLRMVIFTPWDRIRNKNRNKKDPRYPSGFPEAAFAPNAT